MTTSDKATGLPILTPEPKKFVVIDNPQLVAELRSLEAPRLQAETAARTVGFNLVMLIGTAAAVGQAAFMSDKAWQDKLYQVAGMYDVKPEQIAGTDLDSKDGPVITLK